MKRLGIGRTQLRELRLAIRALRVAARHLGYARNLHRCNAVLVVRLSMLQRELARLEGDATALTWCADEITNTKTRRAA